MNIERSRSGDPRSAGAMAKQMPNERLEAIGDAIQVLLPKDWVFVLIVSGQEMVTTDGQQHVGRLCNCRNEVADEAILALADRIKAARAARDN